MAKQVLQVTDFSAGLNAYSDAKDIKDNQFAQNWNAIVDKAGIIRVAGMAQDHIVTEYHDSTNFQKGYGLFQFNVDYSFSALDGNFSTGIKSGTLSNAVSVVETATLEATYTAEANDFQHMSIFIYYGTGIGQTRTIASNTGATPPVLTLSDNWATAPSNDSKYIIYRWKTDGANWSGITKNEIDGAVNVDMDFITDGANLYEAIPTTQEDDYYIFSKTDSITSVVSKNLGYIEYVPSLTLKPGMEYVLNFNCAAKRRWWNLAADGDNTDSSDGHGEKVPWVQLYSSSVSDSSGCVNALTAYTISNSTTATNWTASKNWSYVGQHSTSGHGSGISLTIIVDSSSDITVRLTDNKGTGYAVGDTITFRDPNYSTSSASDITFTIASNGVNRTGLSLYANNEWLSLTDQDGYISDFDRNCVDDGDFQNSGTLSSSNQWEKVGVGLEVSRGRTGYNYSYPQISATGIRMYALGSWEAAYDGEFVETQSYLRTSDDETMELDDSTLYHLNFLYNTSHGMLIAVYDVTNDNFIVNWTTLPATRTMNVGANNVQEIFDSGHWLFPYNDSSLIGGDSGNNSNYITFKTPKNTSNSQVDSAYDKIQVRIYMSPLASSASNHPWSGDTGRYSYVHGVTLRKAHNDLVTMSYQKDSASPFTGNIESFSNYSMKFRIPEGYDEVSTWKLRLHAGQYSWLSGNAYINSSQARQEVYFDNIRLSSAEGETLTLLTNNSSTYSDVSLYSSLSESWTNNFIRWGNPKARPVYTYVNGMLKISDANFETGNSNKLMYYDESLIEGTNYEKGWRVTDSFIAQPPSLTVIQMESEGVHQMQLNLIPYLNKYYDGKFWHTTDTVAFSGATATDGHNTPNGWPLDCFGKFTDGSEGDVGLTGTGGNMKGKYNGFVVRHFVHRANDDNDYSEDNSILDATNDAMVNGDPNETTAGHKPMVGDVSRDERFLYNTDTVWFQNNIDDGNGTGAGNPFEKVNVAEYSLSNRGWSTDEQFLNGVRTSGVHIESNTNNDENPRWPVQFVIQGENTNPELSSFSPVGASPNEVNSVRSIKFIMDFTKQASKFLGYEHFMPPEFIIKVGIPSASFNDETSIIGALESGTTMTYDAGTPVYTKVVGHLPDSTRAQYTFGSDPVGSFDIGQISHTELDEINYTYKHYKEGWYASGVGWPWSVTFGMSFEVQIPIDTILKSDNILVTMQDMYSTQSDNTTHIKSYKAYGATTSPSIWHYSTDRLGKLDNFEYEVDGTGTVSTRDNIEDIARFARFRISNLDMTFYADEQEITLLQDSGTNSQTEFIFKEPNNVDTSGWGGRIFKVAVTSVNHFGEESYIQESDYEIGAAEGFNVIQIGHCPSVTVRLKKSHLGNSFISKTKFYMRDSESDIFYLQFYVDHKDLKLYSTTSSKKVDGLYDNDNKITSWFMEREHMKNFNEVNSYESETMVPQKDALSSVTLTAKYKTSVVANNRLYVGNINQNGRIYGDRMLKSPIAKYNILPASNFIDVAINDGDEITALAYYKDKILQFKKRKVFVINTSGDYEFLEDTFSNVGVNQQCQVVTTPHGIVWANRRGCHLYDGKSMANLIDGVVPETADYTTITSNYWLASSTSYDGIPVVGYVDNRDTLIVKWEADDFTGTSIPDGASYHFPTRSWSLLARSFSGDNAQSSTGAISNMITNTDGDLLFYRYKSADSTATSLIKKWNNASYDEGGAKFFTFTTKDFTFGDVSIRKKIYKVYITYKTNSDSGVVVSGAINSSGDFDSSPITFSDTKSKFQGTSTICYGSSTLDTTGNVWKTAEMRFSTSSQVNNIYSFQLRLYSANIPSDFEINDISIVYRVKSVK